MSKMLSPSPWRHVLLMACVLALVQSKQATSEEPSAFIDDANCAVDDDGRHVDLDRCLGKGERFIRKYVTALGQGDDKFDICERSKKYMNCIEPLLERCPGMKHVIHNHWRDFTEHIQGVCQHKKPEYIHDIECLAKEYKSPLIMRCNSLQNFNIRQNTREECHFLREAVNCKDALITSQCGTSTGQFAYHVFRLYNDVFIRKYRCHLPRNPTYKGFRYTDHNGQCNDFLSQMKICVGKNINRNQMLKFREDNDLIVRKDTSKREIKQACGRYKNYEACMEPVRKSCPPGPPLVYEIDDELRRYTLKMDYICTKAKKQYLPNVRCYNRIHMDGTLKQCNEHVWDDVANFLANVTSHQFYCDTELSTVKGLKQELVKVRLCYEEVVHNQCNKTASDTLSEFMGIVFQDPVFLKQEFRADCDLHRIATVSSTPATRRSTLRKATSHKTHSRSWTPATTTPHRHTTSLHRATKPPPWAPEPTKVGQQDGLPRSYSVRHRASVFVLLVTFFYAMHYVTIT